MKRKSNRNNFYRIDANQVYSAEDFDFTINDSVEALPSATRNTLHSAIKRNLASAVFAIVAGIITIPANVFPFEVLAASAISSEAKRPSTLSAMTAIMEERAALADILFRNVPHPGENDIEPDYGF
jgi:uncharacterized paraquat-inducible protein A